MLYFVKYFLPCFLPSFLMFAFARVAFLRFRLINEKSIGGMFDSLNDETTEESDPEEKSRSGNKNGSLEFVEIEMAQRV